MGSSVSKCNDLEVYCARRRGMPWQRKAYRTTHLGCGDSAAEATAAPVSNVEASGTCAGEAVAEVESGLEIGSGSRFAAGGGTAASSLMMHGECLGSADFMPV